MDGTINNEESIRRYLLGQVNEDEQTRIEASYFDDVEAFALLQTIEGELIDQYVSGQLTENDRQDFENYFLQSSERRQRVEFAQAFQLYVERAGQAKVLMEQKAADHLHPVAEQKEAAKVPEKPARQKSFFDFLRFRPIYLLPVAASLLLTFGLVFLLIETARLRNQLDEARQTVSETQQKSQELQDKLNKEQQQTAQLEKELEEVRNQVPNPPGNGTASPNPLSQIVAAVLSTGAVRDQGGIQKITLFANTETLKLTMRYVGDDENKVNATLKRAGEVLNRADLSVTPSGTKRQAVWSLSAKSLPEGDYLITLTGKNKEGETVDISRFAFRILKK